MASAALVSVDIDRGADIVTALDRASVRVSVAMWACLAEYGDWRLIFSARQFDSIDLMEAYRLLRESMSAVGFTPWNSPTVLILPMNDPFIKKLRSTFGRAQGVDRMRLGGQLIGDRFVEDAIVYRITSR